ncbi:glycosyltransferase [Sessilibacter sp. MAH4]
MVKRLKVATALAGAPVGGAETFFTRFSCQLHKTNAVDVRVFTRDNAIRQPEFDKANANVEHFRFGGKLDLIDHWAYRRALKKFAPDIVLTFMNRATQLTPKGDYQLVGRLGHYYDLKYYRHCDYCIGITRGICDHLIQGGIPASRVVYIPNFVDETVAEAATKSSLGIKDQEPMILALGRLHVNKAFDVLIPAFAKLDAGVLCIAGDGPEKDALQAQAKSLGIEDRVKFLGWRTDINNLLRASDLFVCSSRSEGLGSIVLEAWFNRCPMAAVASQGPGELIRHGDTGLLSPIDDVDELSENMRVILADQSLAQSLSVNGYNEYLQNYSRDKIIGDYLDFFNTIAV